MDLGLDIRLNFRLKKYGNGDQQNEYTSEDDQKYPNYFFHWKRFEPKIRILDKEFWNYFDLFKFAVAYQQSQVAAPGLEKGKPNNH